MPWMPLHCHPKDFSFSLHFRMRKIYFFMKPQNIVLFWWNLIIIGLHERKYIEKNTVIFSSKNWLRMYFREFCFSHWTVLRCILMVINYFISNEMLPCQTIEYAINPLLKGRKNHLLWIRNWRYIYIALI